MEGVLLFRYDYLNRYVFASLKYYFIQNITLFETRFMNTQYILAPE